MWHWILFIIIIIVLAYFLAYKKYRETLRGDVSDPEDSKSSKSSKVSNGAEETAKAIKAGTRDVIKIVYGYKTPQAKIVGNNDFVLPEATKEEPHMRWRGNPEPGKKYAMVMVDIDSPSRADPKYAEWRHWVVVNIPGKKPKDGDVLTKYKGPSPPLGTGKHRYIVKWYEQTGGDISPTLKLSTNDKYPNSNWSSDAFATQHKLKLMGFITFESATNNPAPPT